MQGFIARSNFTGTDFPLCSACLEAVKKERIKWGKCATLTTSNLTKDKNVGYVLERLIGAMTIQQKMDAMKEELVPHKEGDEDDAEQETHSSVDEVVVGVYSHA